MNGAEPEGKDWQSYIEGVGIIEFIEMEKQEAFIHAMNPNILGDSELHEMQPRETHSRVPLQLKGLTYDVAIPEYIEPVVESLHLQIIADTNDLANVVLYAKIDTEDFRYRRRERYEEIDHPYQLENSGLGTLRDVQTHLSKFLKEDIGQGFFSQKLEPALGGQDTDHPGFWFYDFSDTNVSSLQEFLEIREEETLFIGSGKDPQLEQGFTPYADGRCAMHGDGRSYWVTSLGSFPFRYFFLRFQEKPDSISILNREPDPGIPDDVEDGYLPLANSYALLFWALYTYKELEEYRPESVFNSDEIQEELDDIGDTEKADLLDNLHANQRSLDDFWSRQQEQFSSIRTIRNARSDSGDDEEESVIQPLVTAAGDIQSLSEERVDRYSDRYEQLIERVHTHFQTNLGLIGMKLSATLFLLTLATVVAQLPNILESEHTIKLLSGLLAILMLILYVLLSDTVGVLE